MSNAGAYQPSEQELAELQKLSSEYEPPVSGPLVSERQSTHAITQEYANGDPVYQQKTEALPQEFSEYRTCRGDGHCGWRAVAFTYFEALQKIGSKEKFHIEEARLRSFKNLLNTVGFQEHLYEDFADSAFDLLRSTSDALPVNDNGAALLSAFNDEGTAMSIITYLKFLTSAWVKTHPEDFQPFMMGQTVDEFCNHHIEASMSEMEHVGLTALTEVLTKPASMTLEVLYLDRSAGDKLTPHRFEPIALDTNEMTKPPTLRLLYRPGHYDILYKPEELQDLQKEVPQPPGQTIPESVFLVGRTPEFIAAERPMSNLDAFVPGTSLYVGPTFSGHDWPTTESFFTPSSPIPVQPIPAVPYHSHHHHHHYESNNIPAQAAEYGLDHTIISMHQPLGPDRNASVFRSSAYELEPNFGAGKPNTMPFQTAIFRNSHYNTAHYQNPDFQPEEYVPGMESSSNRGKNK